MKYDIHQGDCFEFLRTHPDLRVDYVFTSPPYNRKRNDKYANYDDDIDDYYQFLVDFTELLLPMTSKHVIVNLQSNYYNKTEVYRYIGRYANRIQQIVVWEKSNPLPASGNNVTNAYEMFIVLGDKPLKSNFTYTKNHITTSVNSEGTTKIHRAVMKQEVADWFISRFTEEGSTILDPFMGLGTTAVSCAKLGRDFVGVELNHDYFSIAKGNIESAVAQSE